MAIPLAAVFKERRAIWKAGATLHNTSFAHLAFQFQSITITLGGGEELRGTDAIPAGKVELANSAIGTKNTAGPVRLVLVRWEVWVTLPTPIFRWRSHPSLESDFILARAVFLSRPSKYGFARLDGHL